MTVPGGKNALVDGMRFRSGFDAQGVGVVITAIHGGRAQVDHRIVTGKLLVPGGSHGLPKLLGARPIGDAIHRAAVTQNHRGVQAFRRGLKLTLCIKDRSLGRSQDRKRTLTWKSAAKK